MALVKAKEREMKDEKEAERQVRCTDPSNLLVLYPHRFECVADARSEKATSTERKASSKGRKGAL